MKSKFLFFLMGLGALLFCTRLFAGESAFNVSLLGRVALHGYDPVSYFEGAPAEGKSQFTVEWSGAKWRFTSQEHADKFKANPEAFAPQFGGYCAWAVSEGYTADVDPEAWDIVDGRLYLNYNKEVQKKWRQDRDQRIQTGMRNWPDLSSKK
ncbi:MAG: YHS domain-containing (seleno)protein [Opitutaceae bacterium]|nr:YHS domain-containing (seleno)protein [Opitutaceae bacterium]